MKKPVTSKTRRSTPKPVPAPAVAPFDAAYFLPYQIEWINDESEFKVYEKSRRIGITYATSYRCFDKCMRRKKGFIQWVSSRDMLTAQEFIRDYIRKWCEAANVVASGLYGENVEVIDVEKNIKAFVVVFPNGNRLVSLSSSPEAFAGKGGDVLLDEADLHDDSGRLIDMALPCITWGGQLEIVSAYSPVGSKNTPFAKMVALAKGANPQGVKLHVTTIHDAVAQGFVEKVNAFTGKNETREGFIAKLKARCRTLQAWQSQYECIPPDAAGSLITAAQYSACRITDAELRDILARSPNAPRFAGYDVARKQHAAVWIEFALIGNSLYLDPDAYYALHEVGFDAQEERIRARMKDRNRPRIARLGIDNTGLGMMMAERLGKAFPGRVDEVNLETHRRTELCTMVADRFVRRTVWMGESDQLMADITAPTKTYAANGALRIVIPAFSDDVGETSHSDGFVATMLANSAADAGASLPASGVPSDIRSAGESEEYEPIRRRRRSRL